ncbi:MAG: outer membrane lipoprotein-sorting protein [Candidatus Brocadiae bacterium]|nr:outer membrane lipoprotein-sorting protein [Candidatus Brocadiia bacterium]
MEKQNKKQYLSDDSLDSSQVERIFQEQNDLQESVERIHNTSLSLRKKKESEIQVEEIKEATLEVLSTSQMILDQSKKVVRRTKAFSLDKEPQTEEEQLYRETLRLQQTLQNSLEYIQSLELTATKAIEHKKKKVKVYQLVCIFLFAMLISFFFYYKYGLSAAQKEAFEGYLAEKIESLKKALEIREKQVIQKEADLGKKEKKLGEKEENLGQKEENLGKKEENLGKKEETLVKKEETLVKKEEKIEEDKQKIEEEEAAIQKKKQLLAARQKVLKEHILLEESIQKAEARIAVLPAKYQELLQSTVLLQESTQGFFHQVQSIYTEIAIKDKGFYQSRLLAFTQPVQLRFQENVRHFQEEIQNSQKNLALWQERNKSLAQARQQENFDTMSQQIQTWLQESYDISLQSECQEKVLLAIQKEQKEIEKIYNDYFTLRIRNLQTFQKYFKNIEESKKNIEQFSKDLASKDLEKLQKQEKELQSIQEELGIQYDRFDDTFLGHLETFSSLAIKRYEKFFSVLFGKESLVEKEKKSLLFPEYTSSLLIEMNQAEKRFAVFSIPLEALEKRNNQVLLETQRLALSVAKQRETPKTKEDITLEQIKQNIAEFFSAMDFSSAIYDSKISFYKKEEQKFRIYHQARARIYSKFLEANSQKYFMVKLLAPKEDFGSVFLEREKVFWLYTRKDNYPKRLASSFYRDSLSLKQNEIFTVLSYLNEMNQNRYSFAGDVSKQTVEKQNFYRLRFQAKDDSVLFPTLVFIIEAKNSLPYQIELCDKESKVLKILSLRPWEDTPLGKRVKQIQMIDSLDRNSLVLIQYSDIRKEEIPVYHFQENQLSKISLSVSH